MLKNPSFKILTGTLIFKIILKIYQLEKDQHVKTYRNRNSTIKNTLVFNENDTSYWTQYKRTHDHLGNLRGGGVSKAYPDRTSYNVLTGKIINLFKRSIFFMSCFNL